MDRDCISDSFNKTRRIGCNQYVITRKSVEIDENVNDKLNEDKSENQKNKKSERGEKIYKQKINNILMNPYGNIRILPYFFNISK